MNLEIVKDFPPFYGHIINYGMKPREDTIYPFGLRIYNPSGLPIPDDIMIHEAMHIRQQGNDPQAWWEKYLTDKGFRLSQEIEANREQYKFICKAVKDRNKRFKALDAICRNVSSEIYGNVITYQEARKLLDG